MKSLIYTTLAFLAWGGGALAQTSPGLQFGQVPTAPQWNSYFASKQDYTGSIPLPITGGTMQGRLVTVAPTASAAGLNFPAGTTPTSPVNGDMWLTSSGLFVQISGTTYQFPGTGGGNTSGPATTVANHLALWNSVDGTLLKDSATLPTAIQLGITELGTVTAGVWNGTAITGGNIASATVTGSNISSATVTGSNIAASTVANTNLTNAPALRVKCNPSGSSATIQDCTSQQLQTVIAQTDCLNIESSALGGAGDNATDNAPALTAALAALPAAGGCIYFPPGKFKFNSAISYSYPTGMFSITIKGAGAGATILYWPNASGGMEFTWNGQENSIHVQDMAITTGQTSGGTALSLINTQVYGGYQQATQNDITRVTFQGDTGINSSLYWTIGVNVQAVSYVNFHGDLFYGGVLTGTGVTLSDYPGVITANFNFTDCSFLDLNNGIETINDPQGVAVSKSTFVDGNTGITTASGSTALEGMIISASNFNNAKYNIFAQTEINDLVITGNFFINPDTTGVFSSVNLANVARFTYTGNVTLAPAPTGDAALVVANTHGLPGIITGNTFDGAFSVGIFLTSASSSVNVQSNAYSSAITTKVSNAGSGNTVGGGSS